MNILSSPNFRLFGFFSLLIIIACSPVWAVEYFVNQDGSAHLYSSYIMSELLKNNPAISEVFTFNSISIPNSSGHWLMVLLLIFFAPFTITKIMATLTYAGFVASCGWLRVKTAGREGVKTSLLIGAAIGFNWLWFLGFYNFIIGAICFAFTVGLFSNWREKMNAWRTVILSLLFLLSYFSHIVSFLILAGSVLVLTVSVPKSSFRKTIISVFSAFIPILPLALIYKSISANGGGFSPVWRNLENPFSPVSWFSQIRTADAFIIISRKSFPFLAENSNYFAVFTPLLWILLGLFFLAAATIIQKNKTELLMRKNLIFAALMFSCILAAMFAPDDFGLNNGSVLRERLLLCGLIFFIPLFHAERLIYLKRLAKCCLIFVFLFQTLALWEYSLQTNRDVKEFLSVQTALNKNDTLASIIINQNGSRFHSTPISMVNNYLGIEQNALVWDNYEIGHYLFPVVTKNQADKQFILSLTQNTVFSPNNPLENFDLKLADLDSCLTLNHQKIKTFVVWGKDSRIDEVLGKWFESQPFFENGRVRLFHHK
jgi:hypothetical protein